MPDKTPTSIIEAIATTWIRQHGPMRVLIADGESGLASEETAQWLDRVSVEFKTKAPGEHATMVERHHELLRRIILRTEAQFKEEAISAPFSVIMPECALAKSTLTIVAELTPYRAPYGKGPSWLGRS